MPAHSTRGVARKKARSSYLTDDDDEDGSQLYTDKENKTVAGKETTDGELFGGPNNKPDSYSDLPATAAEHPRHSGEQSALDAKPSQDSLFLRDTASLRHPDQVNAHFSLGQELFPVATTIAAQEEILAADVLPSTAKLQGYLDELNQLRERLQRPSPPTVITASPRGKRRHRKSSTLVRTTVSTSRPRDNTSTRQPSQQPADAAAEMGNYIPPNQQRNMRACMVCSIVRTAQQFQSSGCPNCESFLELQGSADAVQDCTSQVFEGLITVTDTQKSWVARYQRLEGYVPGVYAVQVEGILPDEIIEAAANAGVRYIPRDGSANEALPTEP